MRKLLLLSVAAFTLVTFARTERATVIAQTGANTIVDLKTVSGHALALELDRTAAAVRRLRPVCGTQPNVFYMGATGGGVWKTENYGITWVPITDGQLATGSIGAIDVADSNPNVIYVGTGSEAIRSNVIVGRGVYKSTDAGRTWQHVGLREVGTDRPAENSSEESRHRLRCGHRPAVWLGTGPRCLPDEGRRQDLAERCCSSTIKPASCRSQSTGRIPTRLYAGAWRGAARVRGRSSAADRQRKAVSTRAPTAAIDWTRVCERLPRRSDRQSLGRHRAVESEGRLRAG